MSTVGPTNLTYGRAGIAAGTHTAEVEAVTAFGAGSRSPAQRFTIVSPGGGTSRGWSAGYCSGNNSASGHSAYSAAHGFPVEVYGMYDDSYSSWAAAAAAYTGWLVPERLPIDGNHLNVISTGLLTRAGGSNNHAGLKAASQGGDLASWTTIGRQLLAGGWNAASTILRIGHEMNGTWYPWGTGGNSAIGSFYAGAFRYAVQGIRTSCPLIRFDFCVNAGSGGGGVLASHYPGDAYVDVIGLDMYDGNALGHIATTSADFVRAQQGLGFAECAAFANSHGKQFALDEWGCSGSLSAHDNPFYIQQVFSTLVALNTTYPGIVSHDTYFDSVSYGTFGWSKNPKAAASYRTLWTS